MSSKKSYAIGFDLGGTKVLAVLFDRHFRPVVRVKARSKPHKGEKNFINTLRECFEELLNLGDVRRSEVIGIGLGCPGLVDEKKGMVVTSPNISFLKNYHLAAKVHKFSKLPVTLGNDVNIGLYGEQQFGAAKGHSNVLGIFLGTGIGGALMVDGKLYAGSIGGAGEIGHVLVDPVGPLCGCGRRGCFEALCSRLAIATEAAALAARQQAPQLLKLVGTDILDIKSGQLAQAMRQGDQAITALIKRKSRMIGTVMADMVNLLNPEMIVLGGGLIEAVPSLIIKEAAQAMRDQAMPALARNVKVVAARLGDDAIAIGAAKRAWDRFHHKE